MPALPAVSKVVRVDHHFTLAGSPNVQIREFFQYAGTLSAGDAVTWLTNIVAGFNTNLTPLFSTELSLVSSELTDLSSATAPQVINSTGGTGGDGSGVLAAGTAFVVQKHIARRYRGGHSRTYLPGLTTERLTTETQWSATAINSIMGGYNAYIAAAVANTNPAAIGAITHVNVSYYQGFTNHTYPSGRVRPIPTLRANPVVDAIVSTAANPKPGSQRRRNHQSA